MKYDSSKDPNYIDELNIGSINFAEAITEAYEGSIVFKNLGKCDIFVYGKEGNNIPHFHIKSESAESKNKGRNYFECCVCIYEACYFNHGNKIDQLNSKQRKILDNWLSLPNDKLPMVSNWEIIATYFDTANNTHHFKYGMKKPIYLNMKNYK